MKRRLSKLKIDPVKIHLPHNVTTANLTLSAFGNLLNINKQPHIWCLFNDEIRQPHEAVQPLSLMPYFTLGSNFSNGNLINSTTAPRLYSVFVSGEKTKLCTLPKRLLQPDLSKFEGDYQSQLCIPARNKYFLLSDLIVRSLCPDPAFTEIILEPVSQAFIMRHVFPDGDHLHVDLDNTYNFRVTAAVVRQLAYLAGSPEYRAWQRSVALFAGEALATPGGKPWRCPLPKFKLKVTYSAIDSGGIVPFYRVVNVRPVLDNPFRNATVYIRGKSETFLLT